MKKQLRKKITVKRIIIAFFLITLISGITYSATNDYKVNIHEDVWLAPENEDFKVSFSDTQTFDNITVTTDYAEIGGNYYDFADPTFGDGKAFDIDADNEVQVVLMNYTKNNYEDTNIKFNATATSGTTATITLNNLLSNEGYHIYSDGSKVTTEIANSSGGISFSYSGFSTHTLSIDNNDDPIITNYSPSDGSTVSWDESKTSQDISFDVEDSDSDSVDYEIYNDDTGDLLDSGTVTPTATVSYTWNKDFAPGTTYNIRVEVIDGDTGSNTYTKSFTTEQNDPPSLSNEEPVNNADLEWWKGREITHNVTIDDPDATDVDVTITRNGNTVYDNTISTLPKTVSFTEPVNPDTTYDWTVSTADGDGGTTEETYTYTVEDDNAPIIENESPANNSVGIRADQDLTLSANITEVQNQSSEIEFYFEGTLQGSSTISSSQRVNETVSSDLLSSDTEYVYSIRTEDENGNSRKKEFTFRTNRDPTVGNFDPVDGERFVNETDFEFTGNYTDPDGQDGTITVHWAYEKEDGTWSSYTSNSTSNVSSGSQWSVPVDIEKGKWYKYYVTADDGAGGYFKSNTRTFTTKSLVYIRDEMSGEIIENANITVIAKDVDTDFVEKTELTNGSLNMDNYPKDVQLEINATKGNTTWLKRSYKVPLPIQTSLLLPKASNIIHTTVYELDDRTGEFDHQDTVVRLMKLVENGTVYEAVSSELGATRKVTFNLIDSQTYNIRIVSPTGVATTLGSETIKTSSHHYLKVSSFESDVDRNWYEDMSLTFETDVDLVNGTATNGTVIVRYRDYSNTTVDGTIRIINQTSEELILGPYYIEEDREDITIEIPEGYPIDSSSYSLRANITTNAHGRISKTMPITFDIPLDKSPVFLKQYGNLVSIVMILGFGLAITKVNTALAAFLMAAMASFFKYFEYLETSWYAISYAWIIVFFIFVIDRGGFR